MSDPAATPPLNPVPLDLSDSYGPILIGSTLSWACWGVSCLQLFLYYTNYEDDRTSMKLFVFAVWLIDTVAEIMLTAFMWQILILKWAEVPVTRPLVLHRIWVTSIVFVAVQLFFLSRIYRLVTGNRLKKLLVPILLSPFVLWQCAGVIPYIILTYQNPAFALLSTHRIVSLEISLRGCSAFIDIVIAATMVILLYSSLRRRPELRVSRKMIQRLIVLIAVTGCWTAVVALAELILMAAFPNKLLYGYVEYSLSPLYVNALLANLNARQFLRKADVVHFSTFPETGDNSMEFRDMSSSRSTVVPKSNTPLAIKVDTTRINDADSDYPNDPVNFKATDSHSDA
ncbi:hypothetical protein PYCCODRAFT_1436852 [Trametes coccinea BRFM310]|uniref:DUF6534 domain-containing protein n=1 Tax=Trametes coccinea (strain BRFM310) TaxID=1353009 RepID=A0A1Y2IIU3_TRAC3|nr:hypothetical protein PYCCODRAFT_1436852 [Trametes coccinea BRFM310]